MISNLALVSAEATLGEGVVVEAFSTIYEDVIIGARTKIHKLLNYYLTQLHKMVEADGM